jgi:hypothetical protein
MYDTPFLHHVSVPNIYISGRKERREENNGIIGGGRIGGGRIGGGRIGSGRIGGGRIGGARSGRGEWDKGLGTEVKRWVRGGEEDTPLLLLCRIVLLLYPCPFLCPCLCL